MRRDWASRRSCRSSFRSGSPEKAPLPAHRIDSRFFIFSPTLLFRRSYPADGPPSGTPSLLRAPASPDAVAAALTLAVLTYVGLRLTDDALLVE